MKWKSKMQSLKTTFTWEVVTYLIYYVYNPLPVTTKIKIATKKLYRLILGATFLI